MTNPTQALEADLEALRDGWADALSGGAGFAASVQGELEQMADAGLIAQLTAAAQLRRDGDALLARVAAEVAARSAAGFGAAGLAKRQGFPSPARMVAAATGGALGEASRLIAVGAATAERQAFSGERMPPKHPAVAAGLAAGTISIDAADLITGMLDRVAPRADTDVAARIEAILVARASDLPLDLLLKAVRKAEAQLDQDGVPPREEELRQARSLSIREDRHGLVHLNAVLDPESAAPVKAAIEAIVTHDLRTSGGDGTGRPGGTREGGGTDDTGGAGCGAVIPDERSLPQRQADALAMLARHALGCGRLPDAPAEAVVIRLDYGALATGLGHATIDGLAQPVSAGTVRRLAARAGLIPAVFGGASLPLDLGRAARLFTKAQRLALAERDGGCACCGLDVAYTHAHHIDWWERDTGPTDLNNGVLLCPSCHTRMHQDDWRIEIIDDQVWFTPPAHVDPTRTPRLGGKARFGLPTDTAA